MKTTKQQMAIVITTALLFTACGGNSQTGAATDTKTNTSAEPVAPSNDFVDVDLSTSKLKWPLIAKAAKGYTLDESVDGEVTISTEGAAYKISEWPYGASVEQVAGFKKDITSSDAFKFEKYVLEKPDAFIAKTSMGFIVMRIVKAGEKYYSCDIIPLNAVESAEVAQKLYDAMGMLKVK
jgi:hypothetical protein